MSKIPTATTKKVVPKEKPSHPPAIDMVKSAISANQNRKGVSLITIKKWIVQTYNIDLDKYGPFLRRSIKSGVEKGILIRMGESKGASGSFKLPPPVKKSKVVTEDKEKTEKAEKKPEIKKVSKKAVEKPSKKSTDAKVTKVSVEKKVAKKPAEKEVKKPAEKKVVAKVDKKITKTDSKKSVEKKVVSVKPKSSPKKVVKTLPTKVKTTKAVKPASKPKAAKK